MSDWGKIQIFTGKGKGKTTAASGTALRAYAQGKKVAFIYFDKGGDHYSETTVLDQLGISYFRSGLDRIDLKTGRFRFGVTPEDQTQGQLGLNKAKQWLLSENLDLLVLDEICISAALGIIKTAEVVDLLNSKPAQLELILTGRDAAQEIRDKADLVTEMNLVKHYYYQGVPARKGLDF